MTMTPSDTHDYNVIIEYNEERIITYLPDGQFPEGILMNPRYMPKVADRLKEIVGMTALQYLDTTQRWKPLGNAEDYQRATLTLLADHTLFVSIKDNEVFEDYKHVDYSAIVQPEILNVLTKKLTELELSVRQSMVKKTPNDIFIDIDPHNDKLYEFFSNIESEEKLQKIMDGYNKYQSWLSKVKNGKNQVNNQLQAKYTLVPQLSKPNTNKNEKVNDSYPFTLTVYEKDLNFCFKIQNNTGIYYPKSLTVVTSLEDGSHSISVPNGIGPYNQRTFSRFKKEFGTDCQISDFMYVQIRDQESGTSLYEGIRSKFDNKESVFKLRQINTSELNNVNLDTLQKNSAVKNESNVSSIDLGDIISTTVSNNIESHDDTASARTFEEYDFLSDTEYEGYY